MVLVFNAPTKNNQRGFALLEVLLSLSVALVIIISIVSLGVYMVRGLSESRVFFEAGKIAQRELDRLKILREANGWTREDKTGFYDLVKFCSSSCYVKFNGTTFEIANGVGSEITPVGQINYYFQIQEINANSLNYVVFATWTSKNIPKNYKIEGRLTNWAGI